MAETPADEPRVQSRPGRKWRYKTAFAAVVTLSTLVALGYAWHRWQYPYGFSHCCSKGVVAELIQYAHMNGGRLPAGEATPQASLALVYKDRPLAEAAEMLFGKCVPIEVTRAALARGEPLGPDTCGWHYVEGWTLDDFPQSQIAVLWDKVGLGHSGDRMAGGGREVVFLDCHGEIISAAEWPAFLKRQEKLQANRRP